MKKIIRVLFILLGSAALLVLAWSSLNSSPQAEDQATAVVFKPIPASPPSCNTADADQTTEEAERTTTDDTGCVGVSLPDHFYLDKQAIEVEQAASAPAISESVSTDPTQTGLKAMLQSMFYKILQWLAKF